ncbi:MAG TPA: aminotransferase class III-fold pyridoxal phosphate-dependent enzyme [Candidatus Rubrimentiphilum sp.]|nr:aminotransferase class III-fold pyridoxal phosphate-dependent enzyme [Candidatus Rubrimentiphilum sp.]
MIRTALGHLWLPFTQMDGSDSAPRNFVRGDGNYLFDSRGSRVFDAVSSIWTTIHGHCRPEIVAAIAWQATQLDHSTLLGATNPVAEELAARLAERLRLDRVFYASDGASAVEAAIKMALQVWQSAGQPDRTRFVRLVDAYHGDTAGAMSVSGVEIFKSRFGAITFEARAYDGDAAVLAEPDIAAVIVEPIVQAAAGMRIVRPELYEPLKSIEPLVIVDEIATGFGRTGTMFAHEQLGLQPDIVCIGKGLSGGALPLSATVVKERVFDAFRGEKFYHGHSYAGNPIACAAAIASLNIFESDRTMEHVGELCGVLDELLEPLRTHPLVRDVRRVGLMVGIELEGGLGWPVANDLYERGQFTRPIGDVIQLVPPLTSTREELARFVGDLVASLNPSLPLRAARSASRSFDTSR